VRSGEWGVAPVLTRFHSPAPPQGAEGACGGDFACLHEKSKSGGLIYRPYCDPPCRCGGIPPLRRGGEGCTPLVSASPLPPPHSASADAPGCGNRPQTVVGACGGAIIKITETHGGRGGLFARIKDNGKWQVTNGKLSHGQAVSPFSILTSQFLIPRPKGAVVGCLIRPYPWINPGRWERRAAEQPHPALRGHPPLIGEAKSQPIPCLP